MASSRLETAQLSGAPLPASGRIAVIGPRAGQDLDFLPKGRVLVIQGFRPDHDAFAAAGFEVSAGLTVPVAAAIVCLPRSRGAAKAVLAGALRHLPEGAPVWVDGQKTDGIDAMLRLLKERVALSSPVAKAHGKCAWFGSPGAKAMADWAAAPASPAAGFVAPAGSFSADGVDPGSALLAAALPPDMKGRVADLGAGWGWLSAQVLKQPGVAELHLVEADHAAIEAARKNVTDPRAQFHWADATLFRPDHPFDAVVMNPPFHVSRAADPGLGIAFLRAAAGHLKPQGTLWMVANRQLPYERALAQLFREVTEIGGDGRFKVFRASHPVRRPAGSAHAAMAGRR